MNRKRNLKTTVLLILRRVGWLCKKHNTTAKRIRVSRSVQPDGTTMYYDKPLRALMPNPHSFAAELHVYYELKKLGNPKAK